jgi:arsenate reductase
MKTAYLIILSTLLFSCSEIEQGQASLAVQPEKKLVNVKSEKMNFYPKLTQNIEKILTQNIQERLETEERDRPLVDTTSVYYHYLNEEPHKTSLDKIAAYIRGKQEKNETCEIIFICTHNSRRSHLAQIWAQTAAAHFELKNIVTYSGGTEATAFNARSVAALERAGFKIENPGGENPHYKVRFSDDFPAMECFSKKYSDAQNPQKGFLAVMVCDDADEACPLVAGAEARVSLPFTDPKKSDNSPEEAATYDARSLQIAAEMYYVMKLVLM